MPRATSRFLTLAPDTYTVTVSKTGYQPISVPGQVVFADTVQSVTVRVQKSLTTIAHVDVDRRRGRWSNPAPPPTSIRSTPPRRPRPPRSAAAASSIRRTRRSRRFRAPTSSRTRAGYYATINIRGGDYDQVGYEFDGVPVNRSFDNYASSSASSLGNAEVQVYTGANPANSEGQGLSGFINQVIKTGTYPGYAHGLAHGIGTPLFYHRAAIEIGGATPDRLFSYYIGVAGEQSGVQLRQQSTTAPSTITGSAHRSASSADRRAARLLRAGRSTTAVPGNSYFPLGPAGNYANFATIYARNIVANLHIGIPHHNDAGRDDIQILYTDEALKNQFYLSGNDVASPFCTGAAAQSGNRLHESDQRRARLALHRRRQRLRLWYVGAGHVAQHVHVGMRTVSRSARTAPQQLNG